MKDFFFLYSVLFQAVKQKSHNHSYFVDGGVLCNYPIHCFDGKFFVIFVFLIESKR